MAWDVNSLPQPSQPKEGLLSRGQVEAGFRFRGGGGVGLRLGWCEKAAAASSEIIPPLWLHLHIQAAFTRVVLGP